MVTISNGNLSATIDENGAQLKNLIKDGTEYIWQRDEKVWRRCCPVLFPICGGLKDDKYIYNGVEYTLEKHGFIMEKPFGVESKSADSVTFLLTQDDETLKKYPFAFELRVTFTLSGDSLKTEYRVKNTNDYTMYFSIGSHEGYALPEGIEDYSVIFPTPQTLNAVNLYGNLLADDTTPIIEDSCIMPLKDEYFKIDALVFKNISFNSLTLKNNADGRTLNVDFPDADHLLLWHVYGAKFLCIEPWNGIPDSVNSSGKIEEKEGIIHLDAGNEYVNTHTVSIIK